MSKTCIVHMGMHATGSADIQHTLYHNRDGLRARFGVNYYSAYPDHGFLYALFGDHPEAYCARKALPAYTQAYRHKLRADLAKALDENRSKFFILSGDDLSCLELSGVSDLEALLSRYFDDIHIHISVTDPYSFANAMAQQHILAGATFTDIRQNTLNVSYPDFMPPMSQSGSVYPYYRWRVENYQTIFGTDRVHIETYDEKLLRAGSAPVDFLRRTCGLKFAARDLGEPYEGKHLCADATYLMEALNRIVPALIHKKPNPDRAKGFISKLTEMNSGTPFMLPDFDFLSFAEMIEKDVAWLACASDNSIDYKTAERPMLTAPLWPDLSRIANELNSSLLKDEAKSVRADIYQWMWECSQDPDKAKDRKPLDNLLGKCFDTGFMVTVAQNLNQMGLKQPALGALRRAVELSKDWADPDLSKRLTRMQTKLARAA